MHCDVISMIFAYYSLLNFSRKNQPILRYLYTEVKKRRGDISWHKHYKSNQLFHIIQKEKTATEIAVKIARVFGPLSSSEASRQFGYAMQI